jgi:eukaryotic-like serine/threonine-protein kinase
VARRQLSGIRGPTAGRDGKESERGWFDYSFASALSEDGRTLLFTDESENGDQGYSTYLRRGTSRPERLGTGQACALSPDGRQALVIRLGSPQQLVLLPIGAGDEKPLVRGTLESFQDATFISDGKRVLFIGAERGRPKRTWMQDVSGGPPRAVTPEGVYGVTTSRDERRVAAVSNQLGLVVVELDGGQQHSVRMLEPLEHLAQWDDDDRTLYSYILGHKTLEVFAIDARSGARRLWKTMELSDSGGVTMWNMVMTRDARSYAYSYIRWLDELYVVDGLR